MSLANGDHDRLPFFVCDLTSRPLMITHVQVNWLLVLPKPMQHAEALAIDKKAPKQSICTWGLGTNKNQSPLYPRWFSQSNVCRLLSYHVCCAPSVLWAKSLKISHAIRIKLGAPPFLAPISWSLKFPPTMFFGEVGCLLTPENWTNSFLGTPKFPSRQEAIDRIADPRNPVDDFFLGGRGNKISLDLLPGWWLNQPICKNMRKSNWIISPIFGVNIKNSWNNHLA